MSAAVVGLVSFLAYALYATLQWRRYESPSWDLGIFAQVVQAYARFEAPIVSIKGNGYNILGDHFHPILALLAPLWWLHPSGYTLLIAQAALLAISAVFITWTAAEQVGRVAGWLIGGAYAFSWGVQQAAAVQFHEVAMGAPILAICLWLMLRERWLAAAVWGGLLVFVKEDLGLTVFVLGLVLAWRSRRPLLGGGLAAWGVLWFWLTLKVILPGLNPKSQYDYAGYISLSAVLADPFGVAAGILTDDKRMATVLLLVAATGLLMLRSSLAWIVVPTLTWRFLSTNDGHWGQSWHYSLMLMPVAYAAAIDGIVRLRRSRLPGRVGRFLRAYAAAGPVIIATFAVAISNQLPLFELRDPQQWQTGARQEAAAAAVAAIAPGSTVESDVSLMSYLVPDHRVFYVGQAGNPVADYVVIDQVGGGWNMAVEADQYAQQVHPGTSWERIFDAEGYQVARRVP